MASRDAVRRAPRSCRRHSSGCTCSNGLQLVKQCSAAVRYVYWSRVTKRRAECLGTPWYTCNATCALMQGRIAASLCETSFSIAASLGETAEEERASLMEIGLPFDRDAMGIACSSCIN